MVEEFILNYTGPEINDRLEAVDELKRTVNNTLLFDDVPTEGSNRLITSGAIHEAMKNIDVEADVALTAGDLLEIKDGVIRSTLGDETGETTTIFEKLWSKAVDVGYFDEDDEMYAYISDEMEDLFSTPIPLSLNESYDIYFTPFNGDSPVHYTTTCINAKNMLYGDDTYTLFFNAEINANGEINIVGPHAFEISFCPYEEDASFYKLYIHAIDKLSGVISIGKNKTIPSCNILPENSLISNTGVKIENGQIRGSYGDPIVGSKMKQKTIYNNYCSYDSIDESDYYYYSESDYTPLETITYLHYGIRQGCQHGFIATIRDQSSNDPIGIFNFDNIRLCYEDSKQDNIAAIINSKQTVEEILNVGFIKIDNSKPAIMLRFTEEWISGYGEEQKCKLYFSDWSDSFYSVDYQIIQYTAEDNFIKIPMEALNLDTVLVSECADRIPTSKTVSIYVEEQISEIYDEINETFYDRVFHPDTTPIQYSDKLITSGAVYDAVPFQKGPFALTYNDQNCGLAANKATPTECNSWIEGYTTPSRRFEGYECGSAAPYLNITKTTSEKFTITDVCIKIESPSNEIVEQIERSKYLEFSFVDDTYTTYIVKKLNAQFIDNSVLKIPFAFVNGQQSFSTDYAVDRREFSYLKPYIQYGFSSHTEGYETQSMGECQHVQGKYNIVDTEEKYAHIVGNGNSYTRSNAHTIDWDGNAWFAGSVIAPQLKTTAQLSKCPLIEQYNVRESGACAYGSGYVIYKGQYATNIDLNTSASTYTVVAHDQVYTGATCKEYHADNQYETSGEVFLYVGNLALDRSILCNTEYDTGEYFCFIQRYGNNTDGDLTKSIKVYVKVPGANKEAYPEFYTSLYRDDNNNQDNATADLVPYIKLLELKIKALEEKIAGLEAQLNN